MRNFFTLVIIIFFVFLVSAANAGPISSDVVDGGVKNYNNALAEGAGLTQYDETGVGIITAIIIKAFLGLLGIIFVYLIIVAGYKYMTAQGDEGKIEEALESIKRAVIGLIIIVGAYAITAFVFKNLPSSGSGTGGTPKQGSL